MGVGSFTLVGIFRSRANRTLVVYSLRPESGDLEVLTPPTTATSSRPSLSCPYSSSGSVTTGGCFPPLRLGLPTFWQSARPRAQLPRAP